MTYTFGWEVLGYYTQDGPVCTHCFQEARKAIAAEEAHPIFAGDVVFGEDGESEEPCVECQGALGD